MANDKEFKGRIQHKHDIEANWLLATNFTPKAGELIIYDVDSTHNQPRLKIGDGTTKVNALPFSNYSIDEIDTKLEENKAFIAIEGVTTYQEIVNARDAGRVVQAIDGTGRLYNLYTITSESAMFVQIEGAMEGIWVVTLRVSSGSNHWQLEEYSSYTKSVLNSMVEYVVEHLENTNNPHNVTKTQIGIGRQTGGSDTINWNGDTTGLTSTLGGQFYRVSDATPGSNDLVGATIWTSTPYGENSLTINMDMIQTPYEGIVFITDGEMPYIIIAHDKAVGVSFDGVIVNESGTYFLYLDGMGYISSLTIPNYDGFGAEFKIYKEYLPDDAYDVKGAADEALESSKSYTDDAISKLDDTYYTEVEVDTKLSGKSDTSHTHDGRYYTESEIDSKISTINAAIDGKSDTGHTHSNYVPTSRTINGKALSTNITLSAGDVGALSASTEIPSALADLTADSTHRTVTDTEKATWNAKSNFSGNYNDLINKPTIPSIDGLATTSYVDSAATNAANTVKNDLLNGAGAAYDTLKELSDLIVNNADAIEALETIASSKANASDLTSHTDNTTVHITSTERTNWNAAKTHADSAHAPSNAEPNQNAFSTIITSDGTLTARLPSSNLQIIGGSGISTKVQSNMILINNDIISMIQEDKNTGSISLYTTTTSSNGEKKWIHVATSSEVNTAQAKANAAYTLAENTYSKSEIDSMVTPITNAEIDEICSQILGESLTTTQIETLSNNLI